MEQKGGCCRITFDYLFTPVSKFNRIIDSKGKVDPKTFQSNKIDNTQYNLSRAP